MVLVNNLNRKVKPEVLVTFYKETRLLEKEEMMKVALVESSQIKVTKAQMMRIFLPNKEI